MKSSLILAFLALSGCLVRAQTAPVPDTGTSPTPATGAGIEPAAGSTVITSDELHMDEVNHVAVFTGNVVATGTNFTMRCQEMTVNFDKGGKVDTIVSKGDVTVVQPNRVTHSGQAVYYHDEDKFDLTDQPVINDGGKTIAAPEIIIYRTRQSLLTKGKSRVVIPEGNAFNNTTPSTEQK